MKVLEINRVLVNSMPFKKKFKQRVNLIREKEKDFEVLSATIYEDKCNNFNTQIMGVTNDGSIVFGESTCLSTDLYDYYIGLELAYQRLKVNILTRKLDRIQSLINNN